MNCPTPAQDDALLAFVRHGSKARAAKNTGDDLSNYSRTLRELNRAIGRDLVDANGLTRYGRWYHESIERRRDDLASTLRRIRNDARCGIRVASYEWAVRCCLRGIVESLEQQFPQLKCSTESGTEDQLCEMLRRGEFDIVIATVHPRWRGFSRAELISRRPALVQARKAAKLSLAELWSEPVSRTLYYSALSESLLASFDTGLVGLGVDWAAEHRRRVASMPCVIDEVLSHPGSLGLVLDVPRLIDFPGTRYLLLRTFEPIVIAAFWNGTATPERAAAVRAMQAFGSQMPVHDCAA